MLLDLLAFELGLFVLLLPARSELEGFFRQLLGLKS